MRIRITVLTAAMLAVGGVRFHATARADDPAGAQSANQPAAQLEVELANRPASPAADDVRKTIAEATSAVVQGKFEDAQKRFCSADRKRLGDKFNNSSTLRDHFSQFEKEWKARYDQDFNSDNIRKALADSGVKIVEGEPVDRARLASARVSPDGPKPDTSGALNRDAATLWLASGKDTAPMFVVLRKEDGIGNTWRIDVPDKATVENLENRLNKKVMAIEEDKGSWPADVNDAYRMVTRQVLLALSDPAMSRPDTTDGDRTDNQPATPR